MLKLVNSIVDQNCRLIGFFCEGTGKDFGELSSGKITKPLSIKFMLSSNFSNKQIIVSNGMINEKPGFKVNDLPMVMLNNGEYTPIDNSIALLKRYVKNNENIGFEVRVGGINTKLTYEAVIQMTSLFKPENFVVRNGNENKKFIAGKSGASLNALPFEVLGEAPKAKRVKPGTKVIDNVHKPIIPDIDIMDLYDFVRSANGFIINLPGTKYTATTETTAASDEFIPFDIGEIGTPWLDFNETKLNVSCNFKRPGAVAIRMSNGKMKNVITYVYRRKNIFYNAENHIGRLGVVLSKVAEAGFIEKFGSSMSIKEIDDPASKSHISALIMQQNIKIYEVDVSKLAIIAKSKLEKYVLSNIELHKIAGELLRDKLMIKYLNGYMKELKNSGFTASEKMRDIAPQFADLGDADLQILTEAGINIYDGSFSKRNDEAKYGGCSSDSSVQIGIELEVKGISSLTYKKMADGDKNNPDFINNLVDRITSIESIEARASEVAKLIDTLGKAVDENKRKMWMHKCAIYTLGNKAGLKIKASEWTVDTKKRTKSKCYRCNEAGLDKLIMLLDNIDIINAK